jgi:chromosomal replication initiation ATPase DnaA
MDLAGQLRLRLEREANFSRERFIVSDCNRDAVRMIDGWPPHGSGALALIGPKGGGKTHLAMAWAARTRARVLSPPPTATAEWAWSSGAAVVDDADAADHGEGFFHLLNTASRPDCCLLLTGETPPNQWTVDVPDLRSRLNALPVVELGEPDDAVLRGLLIKLFEDRNIRPPADLLAYLVRRIERSAAAARAIVKALDEAASAEGRPVSRVLARQILQDETEDDPGAPRP